MEGCAEGCKALHRRVYLCSNCEAIRAKYSSLLESPEGSPKESLLGEISLQEKSLRIRRDEPRFSFRENLGEERRRTHVGSLKEPTCVLLLSTIFRRKIVPREEPLQGVPRLTHHVVDFHKKIHP